jgi:hypothetical protein
MAQTIVPKIRKPTYKPDGGRPTREEARWKEIFQSKTELLELMISKAKELIQSDVRADNTEGRLLLCEIKALELQCTEMLEEGKEEKKPQSLKKEKAKDKEKPVFGPSPEEKAKYNEMKEKGIEPEVNEGSLFGPGKKEEKALRLRKRKNL